jgi:ribosomal protein S21
MSHERRHREPGRRRQQLKATNATAARPDVGTREVLRLQREVGNAALGTVLGRQPAAPAQTDKPASFHFQLGPFNSEISTHSQLAALARLTRAQLQDDLKDLPEASRASVADRVAEWTAWIDFYLPYLEKQGDSPLKQTEVDEALKRFREFTELQGAIAQEKQRPVVEKLRQAKNDADAAAGEAEKLKPRSDDALRAAYRSGEESAIKEALHMSGTALDLGVAMHELSREISESIAHYMEVELQEVSHLTEWLTKVNKGLAAINLALALTEEKRATELEEGMRQVGLATEAFAAGAAILGAPAHMVLYANLYVVPLTQAIIKQIEHLVDVFHQENVEWVEFSGELYRPSVEPGGDAMFHFMIDVMHSKSSEEVPPITGGVKDYFLDHRGPLEEGAEEEVPTSGWWFWRKLDTAEARAWVFNHRQRVWAMFYGSMKVPEKKARR